MKNAIRFAAALLLAALAVAGCDSGPELEPRATEILRVEVEPNPVTAGDTATFTCVIRDSLESGFRFTWSLPHTLETFRTDVNQYEWVAPAEPDTYYHQVSVNDQDPATERTQTGFRVIVTEGQN